MEKHIIGRGLLAGALGGFLAFIFARIFVEPVIDRAIAFEEGMSEAHAHQHGAGGGGHEHGVELISRGVQANIGLGFGVTAFAVAMGALFAMLLSLYVVPSLKYPANPPAVSLDETIQQRTLLYLLMVVASAALLVAAVALGRWLVARLGTWNATLLAAGAYLVAVAVVMAGLPTIDETPGAFPADDLYEFRLYSLMTQLVMWATIGLVFAPLAARLLGEQPRRVQADLPA